MVATTLLLAAVSTVLVAATYAYVGVSLARHARPVERRPLLFFAIWWLATALNQAGGGALYLLAAFGFTDVALQTAYVLTQRLLLSASLVALLHYLLTLHTGRGHLVPLVLTYSAWWVWQVYLVMARQPSGVQVFAYRTELLYALPVPPGSQLLALLIFLPPVIAALGLLRLYRRVEGRARRFRIAMLAGGFTVWWTVAVLAGQPALYDVAWFQLLNRVVVIGVAIGILLAYRPMPWMQRRYALDATT